MCEKYKFLKPVVNFSNFPGILFTLLKLALYKQLSREKAFKSPSFVLFIVAFCLCVRRTSAGGRLMHLHEMLWGFDKVPSVFDNLGWQHVGPEAQTLLFNGRATVAKANNQGRRHESHKDVTLFGTVLPRRRVVFCTHWHMQRVFDKRDLK